MRVNFEADVKRQIARTQARKHAHEAEAAELRAEEWLAMLLVGGQSAAGGKMRAP